MTNLLVFRERLKKIYSEYSRWIDAGLRFLLAFAVLITINVKTGYMTQMNSELFLIALTLVACVLPGGFGFAVSILFITLNLFEVSKLLAAFVPMLGLIMYLIYFSFKPGNAIYANVALLLGILGLPAPMGIIIGLLSTPLAVVPAIFGLMIAAYVNYIDLNFMVLTSDVGSIFKQGITVVKGAFLDDRIWTMIVILLVVTVAVFIIRRTFFHNNWIFAISIGAVLYLMLTLIFALVMDQEIRPVALILNLFFALLIGFVLHFLFFMVDSLRVEHVQFEDDEYYYYVKAVPKVRVTAPEVRVTKINSRKVKEETKTSEQVVFLDASAPKTEEEPEVKETSESEEEE